MKMKDDSIQIAGYSIQGDRASQQDTMRYEFQNGFCLAAVCDGMGGMAGGEYASRVAIETIFRVFAEQPPCEEAAVPAWIGGVLTEADRNVSRLTDRRGNPLHAGTTAVVVMITEDRFYWASVGDSRIYYMSDGVLHRLTRMHNYNLQLDEMIKKGKITEAERARESVRGEALISFLGIGDLPLLDVSKAPVPLRQNDVLVLCSDGLYKSLDDQQVQAVLEESGGIMKLACQRLCDEARRLVISRQDNTTVIAIRYQQI